MDRRDAAAIERMPDFVSAFEQLAYERAFDASRRVYCSVLFPPGPRLFPSRVILA